MYNPILMPELREMLSEKDERGLCAVIEELHPATTAEFSEGLDVGETWRLLSYAPIDRQAEIFSFYSISKQIELVAGIGRERMSKLIEEMPPDDRVDLLQRLQPDLVEELLPLVAKADRQDIRLLLSFPDDSAGSIMTTEYAWLPEGISVAEALVRVLLDSQDLFALSQRLSVFAAARSATRTGQPSGKP